MNKQSQTAFCLSRFNSVGLDMRYNPVESREGMNQIPGHRIERSYALSTVDYVFNWARKSAIWPLTFGLACCAIEMIASTPLRFDIARLGPEVFRPSPRQADLMIVAGT